MCLYELYASKQICLNIILINAESATELGAKILMVILQLVLSEVHVKLQLRLKNK